MTQEQSVWFDNSKFYAHFTLDNILCLRDNDTQEEFRFSPRGAYELLEFLYSEQRIFVFGKPCRYPRNTTSLDSAEGRKHVVSGRGVA